MEAAGGASETKAQPAHVSCAEEPGSKAESQPALPRAPKWSKTFD